MGYRDFMGNVGAKDTSAVVLQRMMGAPKAEPETRPSAPASVNETGQARKRVPFGTPVARAPQPAPAARAPAPRPMPEAVPAPGPDGMTDDQRMRLAEEAASRLLHQTGGAAEPVVEAAAPGTAAPDPQLSIGEAMVMAPQPPPDATPPNPGRLMATARRYVIPSGQSFTVKSKDNA